MPYKIIVAHPGKQHSFRLASALKKKNMLYKYITTVYDKDDSILMRIVKSMVSSDNKSRANGRKNPDLRDNDVIQFCQLRGLIEIILARYNKSRNLYNWWQARTTDLFGIKVAKYAIKNNVDAVICYDTNSLACFDYLKKHAPHITRIMDVSAANRVFMKEVYESDFKKCELFSEKLKKERAFLWQQKYIDRLIEENEVTQFFLAPSKFVKRSLMFSNISSDQIKICPYGANFESQIRSYTEKKKDRIEAVFVGNATEMKGIYYLLEAAMRCLDIVHLTIIGSFDNGSGVFDKYIPYIDFKGRVLHEKVKSYLLKSDVFVFPSLGEGLSLSVLEAMACGLPCIVSKNSGANDAIVDGVNGFEIEIQDTEAITEKLRWFYENQMSIPNMGSSAQHTAQEYTWDNYDQCVVKEILDIMSNR